MDFDFIEKRIARQLTARGLPGLFELLLSLKGLELERRYKLLWLYAVGGQSVLYLSEKLDSELVIIKMAMLPYHQAAYISTNDIHVARQHLVREADLLRRFHDTDLPKFYDLIYAVNPLHSPARGNEIVNQEPYLIIEFIQGRTLLEVARAVHRGADHHEKILEWLAWKTLRMTTDFFIRVFEQEDPYLYSDFKARNIIATNNPSNPLRILDASSLIPLHPSQITTPPFTLSYIPPEYYSAYKEGKSLWPTPQYVIYTLGKGLWEILANQQPLPGKDPDLNEPNLKNYSQRLQEFLKSLITSQYDSFKQIQQALAQEATTAQLDNSQLAELFRISGVSGKETSSQAPITQPLTPATSARLMQLVKVHSIQTSAIQRLRYTPDGQHMAVAIRNRVELWDAHNLQLKRIFGSPHRNPVTSLDFDATGKYLVSGSREVICLWDVDSKDIVWQRDDSKLDGYVGIDERADLVAVSTKWCVLTFHMTFHSHRPIEVGSEFDGLYDKGTRLAIAKKRPLIAVGGLGGIRLWDLGSRTELGQIRGDFAMYEQIVFGKDDQMLATVISDISNAITVWDIPTCKLFWRVEVPGHIISDICLKSDGQLMFAGSLDGHLWIWDLQQLTECVHLDNLGKISSLDVSPDKKTLAIATYNGEVSLYYLLDKGARTNVV